MKRMTLLRLAGTVTWPSFLCAGLASVVFFATFDPQDLGLAATYSTELSRMAGYTLGFLGFWALTLLSSLLTAWLIVGFSQVKEDD
ncbi:MAG: hypothetical protein PVI37_02395 [Gammaproteobacteria bacterium]|jgi:hypothetical protein